MLLNVVKYNTSNKIYLSKSKITDFKYTKKLLNYSNASKYNLLLSTSAHKHTTCTPLQVNEAH